ncbi:MAG: hypothetical protein Q9180_009183, partial [Flavoplaca navasiana]
LDDRYFQGLDGQYTYSLHFRISKADGKGFIAENKPSYFQRRSATTELVLEAGQYSVMVKIIATRYESLPTPEDIMIRNCKTRPKKLQAIGRSYDIAHAKGGLKESGLEREERLRKQRREKRKIKAREAFEKYRQFRKKEKLRGIRMKAKDKSSKEDQGKGDLTIRINMSGIPQKNTAKDYEVTIEPVNKDKRVENSTRVPDDGHVTDPESKTQIESSPQDAETSNNNKAHLETTHEEETEKPPPAELTLDDISDDGLSWSSDIDAPPDSDSDESDESDADEDSSEKPPASTRVNQEKTASENDKESSSKGPWNAVCVFGLRVYAKEAQAEIEVIRESGEGKIVKIQSEDWRAAAGG